ncbi:MAG: hypothetical protein JXL81_01865 [Deltaproteobacteria bacterium]|nr:hypothetical protein [Deltaproteobacteria bacterium]
MKKHLNDKENKYMQKKSEHLDMFEILEDIIPLCDTGKAFMKGEAPSDRPIIDNDICHVLARRNKKPR